MTKMEKLIVLSEVMLLGMSVFRSVKEVSIQSCALYCLNSNVLYFENLLKELFMKKKIYIYISWQTWNIKCQSFIFAFSGWAVPLDS